MEARIGVADKALRGRPDGTRRYDLEGRHQAAPKYAPGPGVAFA